VAQLRYGILKLCINQIFIHEYTESRYEKSIYTHMSIFETLVELTQRHCLLRRRILCSLIRIGKR